VHTDSHAEIEAWIRRVMPDLHPIVQRLDELIRETIPGVQYAVKWKKAYYGLPEHGWIIEMVAYDVSVNVVFFGGAEFDPPPRFGTTERARYVKVKSHRRGAPTPDAQVDRAGGALARLAMSVRSQGATGLHPPESPNLPEMVCTPERANP
jgi:hypothetical protein